MLTCTGGDIVAPVSCSVTLNDAGAGAVHHAQCGLTAVLRVGVVSVVGRVAGRLWWQLNHRAPHSCQQKKQCCTSYCFVTHIFHIVLHIYTHTYTHTHTHIYIYILYIYVCVCVYVCMYIYMYTLFFHQ